MKTIKTYIVLFAVVLVLVVVTVFLLIDRGGRSVIEKELADLKERTSGIFTHHPDSSVLGVDISHWDGEIDWLEVKKTDVKFLFIKATQGTTFVDPDFEHNWTSAANYGFFRGAYHFYDSKADPKEQAEHFLSVIKPQKGDLLPVLDIEISGGIDANQVSQDLAIWVETIHEAIGRYPILYTEKSFWDNNIAQDFSHCPLWIAEWETDHSPYLPQGWKDWVFWQYSEKGTVKGMPSIGQIDMDRFNGNLNALKNYQMR